MTTTRIKPVVVTCLHGPRAQCALCSDADPRWREWRVGMGLPEELTTARVKIARPVPEEERFIPVTPLITEEQCYVCGAVVMWPRGKHGRPKHALCKPKQKSFERKTEYHGRGLEGKAVRTFDASEEAAWVAEMSATVRKPEPVVQPVQDDDVYAYWEAHPGMTYPEAERRYRRLQRAVV